MGGSELVRDRYSQTNIKEHERGAGVVSSHATDQNNQGQE